MLRNVYAPTDFDTCNLDPTVPAEEKLRIIEGSPVEVRQWVINGITHPEYASLTLPFVDGAVVYLGIPSFPKTAYSDHINVGDEELYGHGIGSRLVRATIRYAVEHDARITEFQTGWARLGLVNTFVHVAGKENVWIEKNDKIYGRGSEKPLEAVFDDYPPTANTKYLVNFLGTVINRDLAMTWERAVLQPPQE